MSFGDGDTRHIITKIDEQADLHRFKNRAGVEYSAIYIGDFEAYSCEREREDDMIEYYKEMHRNDTV